MIAKLIPAVLLGAVGAIEIYSLLRWGQAAGRILTDNYRSIQKTHRMERALRHFELDDLPRFPSGLLV